MATTNADVVRDILNESFIEIVGRGLLLKVEQDNLKDFISEFSDYEVHERPLSEEENHELENKEYLGYRWKDQNDR